MKSVVGNLEYNFLVFQFFCNPQYIKCWAAKLGNSCFVLYSMIQKDELNFISRFVCRLDEEPEPVVGGMS